MNYMDDTRALHFHLEQTMDLEDDEPRNFRCDECGEIDPDSILFEDKELCIECYQILKNQ